MINEIFLGCICLFFLITMYTCFKIETKIISMWDIVTHRKYGLDNELGILCTYMGFTPDEAYKLVLNHLKKERNEWEERIKENGG